MQMSTGCTQPCDVTNKFSVSLSFPSRSLTPSLAMEQRPRTNQDLYYFLHFLRVLEHMALFAQIRHARCVTCIKILFPIEIRVYQYVCQLARDFITSRLIFVEQTLQGCIILQTFLYFCMTLYNIDKLMYNRHVQYFIFIFM